MTSWFGEAAASLAASRSHSGAAPAPVAGTPATRDSCAVSGLRSDLNISRQQAQDGSVLVVKDGVTGRLFRLGRAEAFIAEQLDGSTGLDEIRSKTERELGCCLTPATLEQFVASLRQWGLLEAEDRRPAEARRRPLVRGNLLYLRLKAFDPDRLLDRLAPRLAFLFTPAFVLLSSLGVAAAFAAVMLHRSLFQRDLGNLWRLYSPILAWAAVVAATLVHELAHAITCKHFGGQVREMGVMLIYFQPALYCNVSDAWLFPRKAHRLWVSFAGVYADMLVASLATLAWSLADRNAWLHYVAMVIMLSAGIRTLFNVNPLIRLDGYYAERCSRGPQSEAEIPGLSGHAIQKTGRRSRSRRA